MVVANLSGPTLLAYILMYMKSSSLIDNVYVVAEHLMIFTSSAEKQPKC